MPLGESMLSTLKSHKRIRLDKSKHFRSTLGGYGTKKKTEYHFPKASPQNLKAIRARLKAEQRSSLLRTLIITFLVILGLAILITIL